MDFLNELFEPAWLSTNFIKAEKAVKALTNQEHIAEAAIKSLDHRIRYIATKKLIDSKLLVNIARNDKDHGVRVAAIKNENLTDQEVLADIAINAHWHNREQNESALNKITDTKWLAYVIAKGSIKFNEYKLKEAGERLTNQSELIDIAKYDKDDSVRRVAARYLIDQDALEYIAKNDNDSSVRILAIRKLKNQDILNNIAKNDRETDVRCAAVASVTDQSVLEDVVKNDEDANIRYIAFSKITNESVLNNQDILFYIARNISWKWFSDYGLFFEGDEVAIRFMEKLTNQYQLVDIAKNSSFPEVRKSAISRLIEQSDFADIAKNDSDKGVRIAAIKRLNNQDIIIDIAKTDEDDEVRATAVKKIINQKALVDIALNPQYPRACLIAGKKLEEKSTIKQFYELVLSNSNFNPPNTDMWEPYHLREIKRMACLTLYGKHDWISQTREKQVYGGTQFYTTGIIEYKRCTRCYETDGISETDFRLHT